MDNNEKDQDRKLGALIERAKEGDHKAIVVLYALYEDQLLAGIRGEMGIKLRNHMESRDLMQSLWGEVLKGITNIQYRDPDSFYAWLKRCMKNKIRGKGRHLGAAKRDPDRVCSLDNIEDKSGAIQQVQSDDPTPSRLAADREEAELLIRLIDELPELERKAVLLRLREGVTYEEIARSLGTTPDNARKICGHGLKALKKLFDQHGGTEI